MKTRMKCGCMFVAVSVLLLAEAVLGEGTTNEPAKPQMAEKGLAWEDFGIGGGGAFMCTAIDPADPDTIYLGADCGGLYKTSDRGKHWRHINQGMTKHISQRFVQVLAPDPRGNGVVYVGMNNGLFRSDDKGENWKWLYMPVKMDAQFACLEFDPDNPDVLYAGAGNIAHGRIIRSRDRGETWELITNGLSPKATCHSICIDPFSPKDKRTIYASSSLGIYRSIDNGASWQLHNGNLALPFENIRRLASFPDKKSKQMIFYLTAKRELVEDADKVKRFRGGILRSDDSGATWREVNGALTNKYFPLPIRVSRKSPDIAWIGMHKPALGIYSTTDGGKTWKHLFRMGENVKVKGLAKFMLKHGCGQKVYDIAIDPREERVLYQVDQGDIWASDNGGETWEALSGDEIRPGWYKSRGIQPSFFDCIAISPHRPDVMLIGDDDLQLLKSEDGGVSWATRTDYYQGDELYDAVKKFGRPDQFAGCIVFDPDVPGVVYASGPTMNRRNSLYGSRKDLSRGWCMKSVNFGDYWTAITPDNGLPLGTVWGNAIAIDRKSPQDKRTVYAAVYGSGIYRSDDSGLTWRPVNAGLPDELRTTCVAIHSQDSKIIYAGVFSPKANTNNPGGVYKSSDAGKTWSKITANPEISGVFNMTINPMNGNQIYVINQGKVNPGLYQSDDGGQTWAFRIRMTKMQAVAVNPLFPEIAYTVAYSHDGSESGGPVGELGGVFRTMDGGKTWLNINGDLMRVPLVPESIALRPDDPTVIFVGLKGPGGYKAVDYEARQYMKKHKEKIN
jgi:photosystem II stability/assembly factor-like uncharacterized protein